MWFHERVACVSGLEHAQNHTETPHWVLEVPLVKRRRAAAAGEIMNALADVFGRYDGAAKW